MKFFLWFGMILLNGEDMTPKNRIKNGFGTMGVVGESY